MSNKTEKLTKKVMALINKAELSIEDLITFYGQLGYSIGASIAGFKGKGPTEKELTKEYYRTPTIDVALMVQGLMIEGWREGYVKNPVLSQYAEMNKEETKEE